MTKPAFSETDVVEIKIPESKKYMAIYNLTTNRLYFAGTSDARPDIEQVKSGSGLSPIVANADYLGYGFSYINAGWDAARIRESHYTTPFYTLDYANTYDQALRLALPPVEDEGEGGGGLCAQGKCTSGGNGSSSCSITEIMGIACTVTCNTGFYACCNSATTRCYCCKY